MPINQLNNVFQNNPYMQSQQMQQIPNIQQAVPVQQQQQVNNQNTNIISVQGIDGANAFNVPAGQTYLLLDAKEECMYIKGVNAAGIPQPIRIFDYKERQNTQEEINNTNYITEEKLNKILDEKFASFAQSLKSVNKKYGNQKGGNRYVKSNNKSYKS